MQNFAILYISAIVMILGTISGAQTSNAQQNTNTSTVVPSTGDTGVNNKIPKASIDKACGTGERYPEFGEFSNSIVKDSHGQIIGFTRDFGKSFDEGDCVNNILTQDNNQPITNLNSTITINYFTLNPDLNITSVTGFWSGDYYNIVGEVTNNGYSGIEFVKVIASLYDKDNKIIGTEFTYTDPTTIAPNRSAPFKLMVGHNDVSNFGLVKSIKLVVSGR